MGQRITLKYLYFIAYFGACFYRGVFFFLVFFEKPFLKDQQGDNANGNRSIRYIEDRTEKFKLVAPDKGKPGRKMCIPDDWKINHIHDSSVKKPCVTMRRENMCDITISISRRAFVED